MTTDTQPLGEEQLPKELVIKCNLLVEKCHKELGWQRLPARIVTKDNMVALACIDDRMIEIGKNTFGAWKLRIACWVAIAVLTILAWIVSWWILLGLLIVLPLERALANSEKRNWMFQAAVLLALEVLANDLAGWGTVYPAARLRAIELLGSQPTYWLDFYLPRRANIDSATWKRFGPAGWE